MACGVRKLSLKCFMRLNTTATMGLLLMMCHICRIIYAHFPIWIQEVIPKKVYPKFLEVHLQTLGRKPVGYMYGEPQLNPWAVQLKLYDLIVYPHVQCQHRITQYITIGTNRLIICIPH